MDYNNTNYNNTNYNQYANYGNAMVDEKGQPLKNNFVLRLVFSIFEIICCCVSPIASVLGIIGCVFNAQANKAYNEGNPYAFKEKAKSANILIWIGGILAAFGLIINIVVAAYFLPKFDKLVDLVESGEITEENIDYMWPMLFPELFGEIGPNELDTEFDSELDTEVETEAITDEPVINEYSNGEGDVPLVEGFDKFTINGFAYEIPMIYSDFVENGFKLTDTDGKLVDENQVCEAGAYVSLMFEITEDYKGMIRVSNNSSEALVLKNCEVDLFYVYSDGAYSLKEGAGLQELDLNYNDKLNATSRYEDVEEFLGVPTEVYEETYDDGGKYAVYSWLFYGEAVFERVQISYWNENICDFTVDHYYYSEETPEEDISEDETIEDETTETE